MRQAHKNAVQQGIDFKGKPENSKRCQFQDYPCHLHMRLAGHKDVIGFNISGLPEHCWSEEK